VGLGGFQDGMSRMELSIIGRFHQIESTINKLTKALQSNKEGSNNNTNDRSGRTRHNREEFMEKIEGGRQMFSSKLAKLEFPIYSGNDPIEWFNIVN
jgi:hypothetical protein